MRPKDDVESAHGSDDGNGVDVCVDYVSAKSTLEAGVHPWASTAGS